MKIVENPAQGLVIGEEMPQFLTVYGGRKSVIPLPPDGERPLVVFHLNGGDDPAKSSPLMGEQGINLPPP